MAGGVLEEAVSFPPTSCGASGSVVSSPSGVRHKAPSAQIFLGISFAQEKRVNLRYILPIHYQLAQTTIFSHQEGCPQPVSSGGGGGGGLNPSNSTGKSNNAYDSY